MSIMEKKKIVFVYSTKCKTNGRVYIGVHGTFKLDDGYIGCGVYSQSSANKNTFFHKAVRKYGYDNFEVSILSFHNTYKEALGRERELVDEAWVKDSNNYNTAVGGRGNPLAWMDDDRRAQHRLKLSLSRKGKKLSLQQLLKYRERLRNRVAKPVSQETKNKTSMALKGRTKPPTSDTTKEKMSKSSARFWLGKKRPQETVDKVASALRGKKRSKESKDKMSLSAKNRKPNYFKSILTFSLNGDFIKEYFSLSDAARDIGCCRSSISANLLGHTKAVLSLYTFKYKEKAA